jgi:hypothetical protein
MDTAKNYKMLNVSDYPILSNIFTSDELKRIIDLFKLDFKDNYKDADEAKNDLYDYL